MEGLELLSKVLKYQNPNKLPEGESMPSYKVPVLYSRQHISSQLSSVFKGFHTCLQTSELNVDLLMKTNQVLYDLMPDVARYPNDLQPEVAKLIPVLVANLGNSKVSKAKKVNNHYCFRLLSENPLTSAQEPSLSSRSSLKLC